MKIAFVTAKLPFGTGEEFTLPEITALKRRGHEVAVFPLRPARRAPAGAETAEVIALTTRLPFLSPSIMLRLLHLAFVRPGLFLSLLAAIVRWSGSPLKILKNLSVLPKGIVLGEIFHRERFEHIHANWSSTPGTTAYIAHRVSGIPWSFTAHNWDISEGNMTAEKVRSAVFARLISRKGIADFCQQLPIDALQAKVHLVHVGVRIPPTQACVTPQPESKRIICVARMVPFKGHKYLIEACAHLRGEGFALECWLAGKGPLERELKNQIASLELDDVIKLVGYLPHDEIQGLYERGDVMAVVLPSIVADDGAKEGIPVALMEAMACGIPVISTPTGGNEELLGGDAGLLVPPRDSQKLAEAIKKILSDCRLRECLALSGRVRVLTEFSLEATVEKLQGLMMIGGHHSEPTD